jgi:hypothetical protein
MKRIIKKILLGKGITFFERFGFHVLPVHYYSPVPSMLTLRENVKRWYKESNFEGINFDADGQLNLLNRIKSYSHECNTMPLYESIEEDSFGEGYGEVESHILHAMIRHYRPHTIVEVGSGVSTFFSAHALSMNKYRDSIDSKIICIEPYPWPKLKELGRNCSLEIINKPVQEVGLEFFKALQENDILFIDSTHIVKVDSDVNYLYLEVLPRLQKGVVIHIHDISFPYPTFNSRMWMFGEHRFWTEQALVHAFLIYNSAFKVLLCSSYLHYKVPDALSLAFGIYDPKKHLPTSLWLQKVR